MVLYDRVEPRLGFAEHVPVVLLGHHYRTAFTVVAASYAEVDIQSCFLERKSDGSDFLSGPWRPALVAVVRLERGGQRVVLGNMVGDAVLQASFTFVPQARTRWLKVATAFRSCWRSHCCVMPVSPSIYTSMGYPSPLRLRFLLPYPAIRSACAPIFLLFACRKGRSQPLPGKGHKKNGHPERCPAGWVEKLSNNNYTILYNSTATSSRPIWCSVS